MATAKKSGYKSREDLIEDIKQLKKDMKALRDENEALQSAKPVNTQTVPVQKDIDGNYSVPLMQLMKGGTDLYYGSGNNQFSVGRFGGSGEELTVSFPDLQRVINTHPFRRYFQELGILILDDRVIKKLNYEKYYTKYDLGQDGLDGLFDLPVRELEKKLFDFPRTLKYAAIARCMRGINEGDARCVKKEVQAVFDKLLRSLSGGDVEKHDIETIYELAQRQNSEE